MGLLNYIATKCYGDYNATWHYMIWCVCYSLLQPKSEFADVITLTILWCHTSWWRWCQRAEISMDDKPQILPRSCEIDWWRTFSALLGENSAGWAKRMSFLYHEAYSRKSPIFKSISGLRAVKEECMFVHTYTYKHWYLSSEMENEIIRVHQWLHSSMSEWVMFSCQMSQTWSIQHKNTYNMYILLQLQQQHNSHGRWVWCWTCLA